MTPRRWLYTCNPGLRNLLTEALGEGWVTDLERLEGLAPLADDAGFRARFREVKHANKDRLRAWLSSAQGIDLPRGAMFDVQIKRIHEYKRQLLNILEAAAHANAIRRNPDADWTPRVKIFGGKAAPAYRTAKQIIRLINDIGRTINADQAIGDRIRSSTPRTTT